MEIFNITPKTLAGEIIAPSSKSFAHRILICSYLCGKEITIKNLGHSDDAIVTLNAIKTLGGTVIEKDNAVTVKKGKISSDKVIIDCGESGSSLRFLLPVVSALGVKATFVGRGKLMERPIKDLVDVLNLHGANISDYTVNGKLESGEYVIDGGISSQYITGLLLALSVLDGESEIVVKGALVSKPYVDITLSVLKDFGVKVEQTERGYKIHGGYNAIINEITVEGDWSGVAFWLVAGAINGKVKVNGLNLNSVQGDRKILDILEKFGASVEKFENSVVVQKSKMCGITLNMEEIPDLCQIVSVLGAYANGQTEMYGVERLKIKESDRIQAIISTLSVAGIKADYDGEKITVYGGNVYGGEFNGGKDHRTVMSAVVLASGANGNSKVIGAEYYTKSYPDFVKDYKKLKGELDVEIQG